MTDLDTMCEAFDKISQPYDCSNKAGEYGLLNLPYSDVVEVEDRTGESAMCFYFNKGALVGCEVIRYEYT